MWKPEHGEFPGTPEVRTLPRAQDQSLVEEVRSHKLHNERKKERERDRERKTERKWERKEGRKKEHNSRRVANKGTGWKEVSQESCTWVDFKRSCNCYPCERCVLEGIWEKEKEFSKQGTACAKPSNNKVVQRKGYKVNVTEPKHWREEWTLGLTTRTVPDAWGEATGGTLLARNIPLQ